MPSVEHEAAVEILHRNPELAAILLASVGVAVPVGATAVIADSNLSARKPVALAAEAVIVLTVPAGKLAVVIEVQKYPPKNQKRRAWPAYVTIAGVEHDCDAILVVIALRPDTARASRRLIRTGHPGFSLRPIVIGPGNTPRPDGPGAHQAAAELAVLGVLTGALDLSDPQARQAALGALARTDPERRADYTRVIHGTASGATRQALEELMKTVFTKENFPDDFVDGLLDQGRAEGEARGEAQMLLRILAGRGFTVPDHVRDRVVSCTDTAQLEAWGDLAGTATSLKQIFGD
jgi:hypothetical protein